MPLRWSNSFNPMLGGILDELTGNLQGRLELYGPLNEYSLNGAFTLSDGHFTVPIVGLRVKHRRTGRNPNN